MLTSLVLSLTPTEPLNLPRDLGRATHALFYMLLAQHDPALAEATHASDGLKPFTCSNVFGGQRQGQSLLAQPGEALWLRYTGLSADISAFLSGPLFQAGEQRVQTVELDGSTLQVTGATLDPAQHPRASQTSYEALAAPYLLSRERSDSLVSLRFVSPTAFRARDQNLPLPLSGSVFGSLADKWNAFAPIALPDEVRRFADECLAISQFRGRTRMLHGKNGNKQIGFVGHVHYRATNKDRYWISLINLLADYAWYAGVGYQCTQGMGQVRRWVVADF